MLALQVWYDEKVLHSVASHDPPVAGITNTITANITLQVSTLIVEARNTMTMRGWYNPS